MPARAQRMAHTPYAIDTLREDAEWAGSGACLEIRIPSTADTLVTGLREEFQGLHGRGIDVRVHTDHRVEGNCGRTPNAPMGHISGGMQ